VNTPIHYSICLTNLIQFFIYFYQTTSVHVQQTQIHKMQIKYSIKENKEKKQGNAKNET